VPLNKILTKFLSMSLSVGVQTKMAFCMRPTKHQNASDSLRISARTGASRSDIP
jgi:hypothetical protein